MGLWTDSLFITSDDLTSIDSEIVTVAEDQNVVLDGATGFIRRQIDEAGEVIQTRMQVFGGMTGATTLSANHLQAVLNVGGGAASSRTKVALSQIVVSDRLPDKYSFLMRWILYRTICSFYRNVFGRNCDKDRFAKKLTEFVKQFERHQMHVFDDSGVPVCYQPLQRPAARFEPNTGSWDNSNVSGINSTGTVTGAYDVRITFTCSTYYRGASSITARGNAESEPSELAKVTLTLGDLISVNITSLNPPDGAEDPSLLPLVVFTPLPATHWNIYAGVTGGSLYLQNIAPIPIATKTYTLAADPLTSGPQPGIGQYADRRYMFMRMLQRA